MRMLQADPVLPSDPPSILAARADPTRPTARTATAVTAISFSVGMIGDRVFRDAPALLLLIFMTNYLSVPPALAGLAIFIPKILILVVDPAVGSFSDNLKTRWGRRRPPMLVGAIVASFTLVLFFRVPKLAAPEAQATLMSLLIFIGFAGYSLFSVPYLTMASEMAHTGVERRRLMAYRVAFMAVGLSFSAFAGGVVQALGGGRQAYATMGWLYGGLCLVTMLATVVATSRVPNLEGDGQKLSLPAQFRLVAGNPRYLQLLLVGFMQKLGEGVGYGSFAYFCIYVVHQPLSAIGLVVVASVAGQVATQPLWLWASRRWSPFALYTVGVLGWCVNLVLWLGMKGQSPLWLIPLGLQGGAAAGGFLMVTLGMLSTTLAADSAESGLNREGVYSGVWLASEKLAFALGALVVGVLLGLFGFVAGANGMQTAQSPTAVLGVGITYVGVNMLVYLLSIPAARAAPGARRLSV